MSPTSSPVVLDARTASDHFPGIGRYVAGLARAMADEPARLDVRVMRDPYAGTGRVALPPLPLVSCRAPVFSLKQQWVVGRTLRACRAALYHSPYYLMPYRPGVPTILTCYDFIPLKPEGGFTAAGRLAYRVAHALAIRAAEKILVPSAATRDDLLARFRIDAGRVVVIPFGADTGAPVPPERVEAVRRRLGLDREYALYVGSYKPHKNLARLLRVWDRVIRRLQGGGAGPVLALAGEWDPRFDPVAPASAEAVDRQRVRRLGPVTDADLDALYAGASLVVLPSLDEGFGLPVLEAMSRGIAVACSNVPALVELAGDAAVLFDPRDEGAMEEVLVGVLGDPDARVRLGAAGATRARAYTWQRTARATLAVYANVLGR